MRAITTITRAGIDRTHCHLVCTWCEAFCEQVHQQCTLTYGSRHGFERPRNRKDKADN